MYSAWKTIKIEPLNVAFISFYLSAPELRVAYFCQPYKMYILWSLAAPKTCGHWLIHPVQEIIITGIHGAYSDLCLHVVSLWLAFRGEGYSFLSPPCLFSLYFKHSRKWGGEQLLEYSSSCFWGFQSQHSSPIWKISKKGLSWCSSV